MAATFIHPTFSTKEQAERYRQRKDSFGFTVSYPWKDNYGQWRVTEESGSVYASNRTLVMRYMHRTGELSHRLHPIQWKALYLLADGFGEINLKFAEDQCWDWSHVRDASPIAFEKMASAILRWERANETRGSAWHRVHEETKGLFA